jgi:hypothetical protein
MTTGHTLNMTSQQFVKGAMYEKDEDKDEEVEDQPN